jgi:hypothetical protein
LFDQLFPAFEEIENQIACKARAKIWRPAAPQYRPPADNPQARGRHGTGHRTHPTLVWTPDSGVRTHFFLSSALPLYEEQQYKYEYVGTYLHSRYFLLNPEHQMKQILTTSGSRFSVRGQASRSHTLLQEAERRRNTRIRYLTAELVWQGKASSFCETRAEGVPKCSIPLRKGFHTFSRGADHLMIPDCSYACRSRREFWTNKGCIGHTVLDRHVSLAV